MTRGLPAQPAADVALGLDNCDREPIHIPGRVQAHGVLVVFDMAKTVSHRSANVDAMLGPLAPHLGHALAETCFAADSRMMELLQECFDGDGVEVQPAAMEVLLDGRPFEMIGHRLGSHVLVELEVRTPETANFADDAFKGHRALSRLRGQRTVDDLLAAAVQEVRAMTGFDRVMAYRFRHDDSGDVVSEVCAEGMEPFAGRRYPASDIPAQARRLYTINTLRTIIDVSSATVPIEARPDRAEPLDLSHSVLRSVSPVHIEYLGNMGVAASMSISIVINGKLWGMVACHHRQPRHVPYRVRSACDVLAHILAANIQGLLVRAHAARLEAAATVRAQAIQHLLHADDGIFALQPHAHALCEMFDADAIVLAEQGRLTSAGGMPQETARELVEWLAAQSSGAVPVVARDSLDGLSAPLRSGLGVWCGFLALGFNEAAQGWLVLMRKEQVETIAWGGKPDKDYTHGPLGPRLTPRGSFDVWKETVRGRCVPWSATDLEIADGLMADLVRASAARSAELDRARSHLLSMLGQGVGTPLVLGTSPPLSDGSDPAVANGSSRMLRFVGQVLDAALLRSGTGLNLQFEPVNLSALVNGVLDEESAAHPSVRFVRETRVGFQVMGDAARLRQVVACLVGNARRHGTPDEAIIVQLHRNENSITLEVSNVGSEIAPDVAASMFDPFRTPQGAIRPNADGLGLGLYIARHVARAHGGELDYAYAEPYVLFTLTLVTTPAA